MRKLEATMNNAASILAINAGSSSIKFALYGVDLAAKLSGQIEGIGTAPHFSARRFDGTSLIERRWPEGGTLPVHALMDYLMDWLEGHLGTERLAAVGHRVATGGLEHSDPLVITAEILEKLRGLTPLAPLHQPRNLEPIESLKRSHPGLPQVACFDTAFHRTLPPVAANYGLPRKLTEAGARRYGFHGLSYEYIAGRLKALDPEAAAGRCVVAHLGSGASMCALRAGKSIATTMGFSPLSGLVMATRPGDLDPGLIVWLLRERGMSIDALEQMLYRDCGLKGVSGVSGDMRTLLESGSAHAVEAVELFVYRIAIELGGLTAALGGLDALVFTAGIGEHASAIRRAVCERLAWLGVRLDPQRNANGSGRISADDSTVRVWAIPTDEELVVATHTAALVLQRRETDRH
jgi:acetate kinase